MPTHAEPTPSLPYAMDTPSLPPEPLMQRAILERDASYEGVFVTAVRTTGIFCRPTCPARKPRPDNVRFFATPREALLEGFRPCRRCRPMEAAGEAPSWVRPLLDDLEDDPARRWTDQDLRSRGLSPERVRRWFQHRHGMSFHAYSRARRLGAALGQVRNGSAVSRAAFDAGYDSLSGFQDAFRRYFGAAPTELEDATVVQVDRVETPLGPMLAAATGDDLCLLEFVDRRMLPTQVRRLRRRLGAVFVPVRSPVVDGVATEMTEYFAGERTSFGVPLLPVGTAFQEAVWSELRRIPHGETRSYGELARDLGRPDAVRAVGRANGLNALAIVVPCHRVVGADGRLVGYGGGLWRKKRLLELEQGVQEAPVG